MLEPARAYTATEERDTYLQRVQSPALELPPQVRAARIGTHTLQASWLIPLALVLGACIRFTPALTQSFPVLTGGLFYSFVNDIRAAHYVLPSQTTYNSAHLPFAYPPLSFYTAAVLADLGWPVLEVLRWLPAIIATAGIVSNWFLWRRELGRIAAGLSAVAYALIPLNLQLVSGGGGLSRSFGLLALQLALWQWSEFLRRPGFRRAAMTGVLAALTAASHPEAAAAVVYGGALFWAAAPRPGKWWRYTPVAALSCIVLSAFWMVPVVAQHGLAVFLGAAQQPDAYHFVGLGWIAEMNLTGERVLPVLNLALWLGVITAITRGRWLVPAFATAILVCDQRAPTLLLPVAAAPLVGIGIADGLLPILNGSWLGSRDSLPVRLRKRLPVWAMLIVIGLPSVTSVAFAYALPGLDANEIAALDWVSQNMEADARVLVISPRMYISEWFPALTGRHSVATHEGTEWLGSAVFGDTVHAFDVAQDCAARDDACLDIFSSQTGRTFDAVFIANNTPLAASIEDDARYRTLYDNPAVIVAKRLPAD